MLGKVLIYGASGGIGSACARLLSSRGYSLHLAGRNQSAIEALADELQVSFSLGDVTDDSFFESASAAAGESLSGLVYAIGSINLKTLGRLKRSDFLRDYELNALGAALAIQAALPALKKSGEGSVVLFSSIAAAQGFSMHASIGMAKAAVSGLTLSLAAELAPSIRVNAIAPSLTQTPLAKGLLQNETVAQSIAALHPIPRLGIADEMAELAAFLLAAQSSWITGQIIGVDGGRSTLRVKG
jgi:NAD(P)-dependent dehydrogenase (short-subunit alcohol dehydrogenase family)